MAKNAAKKQPEARNILYLLTYFLVWLSGLVVYVTEGQKSRRAKFHALQAIFLGVIITILALIPFINLIALLLWIYGLYVGVKAYEGSDVSMPVLGDYAKSYSG